MLRVAYDLTPVHTPRNRACVEYLLARGAAPAFMVYEGTVQRAHMWGDTDALTFAPGMDWGIPARENYNPPVAGAFRLCAKLAANARTYAGDKVPPSVPLIYDLESEPFAGSPLTPAHVAVNVAAVQWAKQHNPGQPNGHFYWPPLLLGGEAEWDAVGMDEYAAVADYAAINPYTLRAHVGDFAAWDARLDQWLALLAAKCPNLPKWAVVSPAYQIQGPGAHAELHNTPVPLAEWRRQLAQLVAAECDVLIWNPGEDDVDLWRPYLDAALEITETPMPPETFVADTDASADAVLAAKAAADTDVTAKLAEVTATITALQAVRAKLAAAVPTTPAA